MQVARRARTSFSSSGRLADLRVAAGPSRSPPVRSTDFLPRFGGALFLENRHEKAPTGPSARKCPSADPTGYRLSCSCTWQLRPALANIAAEFSLNVSLARRLSPSPAVLDCVEALGQLPSRLAAFAIGVVIAAASLLGVGRGQYPRPAC